jgi:hypothetical protein
MDGFKSLPKMQCFREGGSVKSKPMAKCAGGKMKEGGKADIAQDKAMVKKAFAMHDKQEHHGEKTDLSKLKKGGRSKKAVGSVKKFKTGGAITNVYEAKKSSGDKDNIRKTKQIKPAVATAPSKAATKPNFKGSDVEKEKSKPAAEKDLIKKVKPTGDKKAAAPSGAKGPDAFKKGGKVKKYNEGKLVAPAAAGPAAKSPSAATGQGQISDYERNRMSNISKLDPAQQAEFAKQQAEATAKYGKKKGGKIKKFADGGLTAEEKDWLGGADATDPFIQARMRAALGPKKPQGSYISSDVDNRDVGQTGGSIDDESKWGNVSPAAAAFNKNIPGAGMSTPAAAPSAPVRRPVAAPAPYSNSQDARLAQTHPAPAYSAPNVEQDSGVAYPQGNNPVSSLRSAILPSFGGSMPSAFPAARVAPRPAQTIPSANVSMPSAFPAARVAPRPAPVIPSANLGAPTSFDSALSRVKRRPAPVPQKRGGKAGKKGC